MSFAELQREDICYRQYNLLTAQMAVSNQIPLKVLRYVNDKTVLFLIIKQSLNGTVTSKKITLPLADAVFFTSYLANDFPELEIEAKSFVDIIREKEQGA